MKTNLLGVITTYVFFAMLWACTPTKGLVGVYNITDYGAKPDSITLNTTAIQSAIDDATQAGGGKVIVPPGVYLSGTIFIKSNVTLEVMAGARLKGSPNLADYKKLVWGHNRDRQPYHFIVIENAQNVTVCGAGTIDGNGPAFWQPHDPKNDPQWIKAKDEKISPMFEVFNSKNVFIREATFITGGGWTMHLYNSDHITVDAVRILNNMFSPNGDGIDISGCSDVTISNSIIKTCDDAICLKTMVDTRECHRVTVTNCVIECSCAALKIGNETYRDITQVTFSNCIVYGSSRAIGLYSESCGKVEDISITNIICDSKSPLKFNRPIHISLLKKYDSNGLPYAGYNVESNKGDGDTARMPTLKNIMISNLVAKTEGRILVTAQSNFEIENLTMRDIVLEYPYIEDPMKGDSLVRSHQYSPYNLNARKQRAAFIFENVRNLVVENVDIAWPKTDTVPSEWKFKKRIANGTFESFYEEYKTTRPCSMSAVWANNIKGGWLFAPLASASDATLPAFNITNSDWKVRKLD